jgi:serine/threonine-protein kinase
MIHEVVETEDGRHCIVMEYIDGVTLRQHIADTPMSIGDAVDVAKQVASALSAAHAQGIIHRDIKLENIMIRRDGYVKVLDFGLAKLTDHEAAVVDHDAPTKMLHTSPGMVVGTVYYMSPEQARGLIVDRRTDLWSLGVVLYEMVTREQPFTGATPTDVIISIVEREPAPLSKRATGVPSRLDQIVSHALAKDPPSRYQTADDFHNDLKLLRRELDLHPAVEPVSQQTNLSPPSPRTITSQVFPFAMTRAHVWTLTGIVAVLILGAFAYMRFWRHQSAQTQETGIKSLAVLPMANLSNDPAQDYFADGMTETVIAGLAKIGALRVISRTSVMPYKGAKKPLPEIARELNVDAIVEGSVQRFGEQVQININLINGASENRIWSNSYKRDLREILNLQNEVVRDLSQQIQIKLTPQEQTRLSGARSINAKAYDYFLRGRFYASRQSKEDNETAIENFEQGVAEDPEFAAAWAELAQACIWRLFLFTPGEKKWEEKASVAIQRALDIDPDLPEAHLARGRLLWTPANHFPHDRAILEYRRALAGNPNVDEAQNYLALVYIHIGAFEEARNELHKAMAINPSNGLTQFRISEAFLFEGKYEQALNGLRSTPRDVNPALVDHETAWALLNLGRKAEATEVIEKYLKEHPEDYGGLFAGLQAVVAATERQDRLAEEKIKLAVERGKGFGHFHHTAYYLACAYARMNKPEEAVNWLQNAADDGFPCYPLFASDSNLNNLRQDPRFVAFLEKQKQLWESYRKL